MIIKAARLNEEGCESLVRFVENPSLMGADDECEGQRYLPGVSVPYYPGLEKPFNLPLRGDYEPLGVAVEWPRMGEDSPYSKCMILMGMLVAESVTSCPPLNEDSVLAERDDLRRLLIPEPEEEVLDEAFDEFTLEFGGLFKASVAITEFISSKLTLELKTVGSVEFMCFESREELDQVREIIRSGQATLGEVIGALRLFGPSLSIGSGS